MGESMLGACILRLVALQKELSCACCLPPITIDVLEQKEEQRVESMSRMARSSDRQGLAPSFLAQTSPAIL